MTSSQQNETDPDHDLIHSFSPPVLQHRSRRALLQQDHLAFSSIDPSQYQEKRQYAGMSSAAACIVLEMPTMKPLRTSGGSAKQPSVELSSNNRKRRGPVSTKEIQTWRNTSNKACYRFKPVYTHQFFTDEKIQGYRPTDGAIEEARSVSRGALNESDDSHHSFSHHGVAGHTLSIQVRLAPSCRKCCLLLHVGKVKQPPNKDVNSSEKSRVVGRESKSLKSRKAKTTTEATCGLLRKVSISSLSDAVSSDGDDEDDGVDYELKSSDGGRKRRRAGQQKKPCRQKEQGRTTTVPTETSIRRSKRNRVQVRESDRALSTISESEVAPGESRRGSGRCVQPWQSKRLSSSRQVTDVSDNDASSPSSDEEVPLDDSSVDSSRTIGVCCSGSYSDRSNSSCSTASSFDLAKMKIGTIITQVSAGLPETAAVLLRNESADDGSVGYKIISSSVNSIADIENDYLDQPIGKVIREYSREKTNMSLSGSGGILSPSLYKGGSRNSTKSAEGDFVLTLADMRTDKDARKYHDEVEKISQWFIEIASCVQVGLSCGLESDGGYWKVLYLFEKHRHGSATKYSLVGYVTLFYRGLKMTVSQAVCLPLYQRSGHGTEMLMAAYGVNDSCEILVESPAPAFVALRNRIDYALLSSLIERTQVIPGRFTQPTHIFSIKDSSLPHEVIVQVGSALNITPRQVVIAFDVWKLGVLEKTIRNTANSVSIAVVNEIIASLETNYKSTVKRTLLKALRENQDESDFSSMETGEQRECLEKYFNTAIVRYHSILK